MTTIHNNATELANLIHSGQSLCLAPDYSGCAMSVVLKIIKQGVVDLKLTGVPQLGLQADWLIGAGCVRELDAAAVTLGEYGQASRFITAIADKAIRMNDSTCPVIHAGLQAAEKGIPFMPLRGIIGSDLVRHRPDWTVISNPLGPSKEPDPILIVPAIQPDIALIHAPKGDRLGNVWIGIRRELMLMAHASTRTIVSVEEITDENLLEDPVTAAGTIPSLYISDMAEVKQGAHPVGLFTCYEPDHDALSEYAAAAKTQEGFDAYLNPLLDRP